MAKDVEWALVADGGRARFLERRLPAGAWHERAEEAIELDNPPSRARLADRPGRVQESAGASRHAVEPRSDPHRAAKAAFARRLAERIEAEAGAYGRLVLIAPPHFLGELRAALGDAARARLRGTLDKDLTRSSLADIVAHLEAMGGD